MALTGEYQPSSFEWVRDQVATFEATGGAEANTVPGTDAPIVVITSRGAKSGKLRKNPVLRVERDGTYLAVASKGGAPQNPEWHHNLSADPVVDLQDGAAKKSYRARRLEGSERTDWWTQAVAIWPAYTEYAEKTDREIPLWLLEPID